MTISLPAALALAAQCAPSVAPETLLSVAHTESKFDPLAIGVNGGKNPPPMGTATDAAQTARRYIAAGYSVDLGIAQINSANLGWLGLSVEDAFDPCRNLAAAARVLSANYTVASRRYGGVTALGVALSMYNTGNAQRGYRNGYVGRVYRTAASLVPAITGRSSIQLPVAAAAIPMGDPLDPTLAHLTGTPLAKVEVADPVTVAKPTQPIPAKWDVFAVARRSSVTIFKGVGQ